MPNKQKIFVTKTFLPPFAEYTEYLKGIWDRRWITNHGKLAQELEARLKKYFGVKHALLVSNGTMALQLAIKALDLNGEIITTPFSFVATTTAILWEHCTPIFVDIDPKTFCIDTSKIEAAITEKTKAILAVHVYGYPCNVEEIERIAKKHNLKVIYDAAHTFGVEIDGKSIFQFGDISILSLHATKLFHTGEGGLLATNDDQLARKIKLLRDFGLEGEITSEPGINAKNSEFHSALGLANLKYVDSITKVRSRLVEEYKKLLVGTNLHEVKYSDNVEYNHAYFPVVFKNEKELLIVKQNLEKENIFPRRYFYPSLNTLPFVKYMECPVSESIAKRVLCLPLYHDLSLVEVGKIVEIIKKSLGEPLIKVSVGISAHNEEKNIKNVIADILGQVQDTWTLEEIIVYCDSCDDNTVDIVKAQKNKKIKVIEGKVRKGKVYGLSQIFKIFSGDIILILDADIKLADRFIINNLIEKFLEHEKVVLVGGNTRPLSPRTFFEKAVYSTFIVFENSREKIKNGNNIFGCVGTCIALKRDFAKSVVFPKVINEDDFLYFTCIIKGYKFLHAKNAIVFYKLPKNLKDYLRQVYRSNPEAIYINFKKYFGDLVYKEYKRPKLFYLKSIFKAFQKYPLPTAYIILVNIFMRPFFPLVSSRYNINWYTAKSTK